jgi:hypothetical protein
MGSLNGADEERTTLLTPRLRRVAVITAALAFLAVQPRFGQRIDVSGHFQPNWAHGFGKSFCLLDAATAPP